MNGQVLYLERAQCVKGVERRHTTVAEHNSGGREKSWPVSLSKWGARPEPRSKQRQRVVF